MMFGKVELKREATNIISILELRDDSKLSLEKLHFYSVRWTLFLFSQKAASKLQVCEVKSRYRRLLEHRAMNYTF